MANTPIKLNDGNTVPWLGFGTGTALYEKDSANIVSAAIKAGFTHLDGAQVYANEDSLGAGLVASGKPRSELFVTTKLYQLETGTVRSSLLESLKKLKLDYVDLFLIHSPAFFKAPGQLKNIWKQFEEIKKEGLAKSIGVSNFRIVDLETILDGATVPPAVNQIEYHPYLFKASEPLLEFQKKHGIITQSYAGQSPIFRSKGGPVDPVLTTIAERLSKTVGKPVQEAHILLLWQRYKGIVFVTTTTKEARLAEYISTANLPDLTAEEVAAIDAAGATYHKRHFTSFWPENE